MKSGAFHGVATAAGKKHRQVFVWNHSSTMSIITDRDDVDTKLRRLCSDCVGESYLREKIRLRGAVGVCFYCGGEDRLTFAIEHVADEIEVALQEHYYCTADEPSGYEYMMIKELDYDWERKGYPIADVIADCAEITSDAAEDIRSVLFDRHDDFERAAMGEENPFDQEAQYEEKDVDDAESQAGWAHFEKSLQTEGRFFNRSAEATIASVFEGLAEHKAAQDRPIIVGAGPATQVNAVYRARVFQADEMLEKALKSPVKEIGPPTSRAAASGRMNAHGIAVFYGATDAKIALTEVRPPIGSKVVVGRFELIRAVRLLDIEALRSVYVDGGSIFDRGYIRRLERAKFLRWLSEQMTLPVMPNDEPVGYLPTQAIADFLAGESDPPLDGILYPSVQGSEAKLNVVLFHKASRVEALAIPEGTEISAQLTSSSEEGDYPNYSVWEKVPSVGSASSTHMNSDLFSIPVGLQAFTPEEYDAREVTLRLDVSSLEVHHVTGLIIETNSHKVSRHRFEKTS